MYMHVHVLMRDEKEGRKKQARSNKLQGKATQYPQASPLALEKRRSNMYLVRNLSKFSSEAAQLRTYMYMYIYTCVMLLQHL